MAYLAPTQKPVAPPMQKSVNQRRPQRAARGSTLGQLQQAADTSGVVQGAVTLQQMADAGRLPSPFGTEPLQGAFKPVVAASNAHLRNNGAWDNKIGNRIDRGQEFIADPDATQIGQERLAFRRSRDTAWARAVKVSAEDWDYNTHAAQTTYVRASRIQANARNFPEPADDVDLPSTQRNLRLCRKWSEQHGIYVELEPSVSVPGTHVVLKGIEAKRLTDAGYVALDEHEKLQLNDTALRDSITRRVRQILQVAATGRAWETHLYSDDNINKLIFDSGGSKAVRWNEGHALIGDHFVNWYRWLNGAFDRIRDGANFMTASLEYWCRYLNPEDATQVAITGIRLSGSDLHEEGLGAVFVDFTKPRGPEGHKFKEETELKLIIKSEDKSLEKGLFGTEDGSLANQLNSMAKLNSNPELGPTEALTTFRMETSQAYGSLIEMVNGVQPDTFDRPQTVSPAMREAMVFAFITGLSDLHKENVLWHNGTPYFIDADNAMNNARVKFGMDDRARDQTGFTHYNNVAAHDLLANIRDNPSSVNSKLIKLLVEDDPTLLEPVIDAVRNSFAGKTGRVVPVDTESWAGGLRHLYIRLPDGNRGDDHFRSRWGLAKRYASRVPTGGGFETRPPGLQGEAGEASGGGAFQADQEEWQIKADYDKGQIPFYTYVFDTGRVLHNGQVVWNGEPLDAVLETLLDKFPAQRDTWQTG